MKQWNSLALMFLVSCCFEASMDVDHSYTKNLKAQLGENKSCLSLAAQAREQS